MREKESTTYKEPLHPAIDCDLIAFEMTIRGDDA